MVNMKDFATLLLALLCVVSAVDDAKERPVSKVITVMKDMVTQLEAEADQDEETYEAFACWCFTNDKEKTKSIADGEQEVQDLTAAIEGFTATSARLNEEIEGLEAELAKNTQALDSATAMRQKESAEFKAEEKDTLQTIASLKSAIVALSKHHEAALVQGNKGTLRASAFVQNVQDGISLRDTIRKNQNVIAELFTPKQRGLLNAFVQDSQEGLAPASGEIFGILNQMKETFESNLANSQAEEKTNQMDYESLKATKEEQIKAGQDQLSKKTEQLTTSDIKNVNAKADLEDTERILATDIKFLANLKDQCGNMDAEYEERTQTRHMEIAAVNKALEFLSSDEAHDLFSRSFNFFQVSKKKAFERRTRDKISKILARAAHNANDPKLSMLATTVKARMDAFTKVKESIQGMIDNLVKEKEDEIKHKTYCVAEIAQNEADIEAKNIEKSDLEAKIEDLTATIHKLNTEIEALKAEVAELQVQIKRAGENREKANKEFQIAIADQRATQKLLGQALDILKGFYEKAALMKTGAHVAQAQAPPPGFKSYEKNHKSGGVMGMMKGIIADSEAVENEAIRGEEYEQKLYEDFVMDSNLSIENKIRKIVNLEEVKAKAEQDKVENETQLKEVLGELEALDQENADLHKDCDFTINNFDVRQTARDDEIKALKESLEMMGGAAFVQFVQTYDPPTPAPVSEEQDEDPDAPVRPMSYEEWEEEHDEAPANYMALAQTKKK